MKKVKTYIVTATHAVPLYGNFGLDRGYEFRIPSRNAAEAVKRARRDASNAGHTRQDGSLVYRATVERQP